MRRAAFSVSPGTIPMAATANPPLAEEEKWTGTPCRRAEVLQKAEEALRQVVHRGGHRPSAHRHQPPAFQAEAGALGPGGADVDGDDGVGSHGSGREVVAEQPGHLAQVPRRGLKTRS